MNYTAVFTCSALDSQRPSLIAGPQMESRRSIKMRFIVKHGIFYVPLDMALANKRINQKRMERFAVTLRPPVRIPCGTTGGTLGCKKTSNGDINTTDESQ